MSEKHIHKYQQVHTKFKTLWKCGIPSCKHFMPEHLTALIIGRASLCWNCGETFVMTEEKMSSPRPICNNCDESTKQLASILEEIEHSR